MWRCAQTDRLALQVKLCTCNYSLPCSIGLFNMLRWLLWSRWKKFKYHKKTKLISDCLFNTEKHHICLDIDSLVQSMDNSFVFLDSGFIFVRFITLVTLDHLTIGVSMLVGDVALQTGPMDELVTEATLDLTHWVCNNNTVWGRQLPHSLRRFLPPRLEDSVLNTFVFFQTPLAFEKLAADGTQRRLQTGVFYCDVSWQVLFRHRFTTVRTLSCIGPTCNSCFGFISISEN